LETDQPNPSKKKAKLLAFAPLMQVVDSLISQNLFTLQQLVTPAPASPSLLLDVHCEKYLQSLEKSSLKVAQVTELAPLALMPAALVRDKVLKPMKHHVGGGIMDWL
jgi:hypothetical protein